MSLTSVEQALQSLTKNTKQTSIETIPLERGFNRVLAQDLTAKLTQPPFHSSAMDGYAIRFADVQTAPTQLTIIGQSAAGHGFKGHVQQGQAVRIFTGAPVPEGTDTVVIQEDTQKNENTVTILETPTKGKGANIRPAGQDFHTGQTGLSKGKQLTARDLTLAASMNYPELPVYKSPTVAILATGDELVLPGMSPKPDQIISSVSYGLQAMISSFGGTPIDLGIAQDNLESLQNNISKAQTADILITIGGASVGDHDLVQQALKNAGMELNFWKIAMRPGKPLMSGSLENTQVLGLPGNPVSALICARIFLVPIIQKMLGKDITNENSLKATLTENLPANGPRQHYMRANITQQPDGTYQASRISSQDSSLQYAFTQANGLIICQPNTEALAKGESVPFIFLDF